MSDHSFHIDLTSPEETHGLAKALAPYLSGGDTILLTGPVGAGKTLFARALIQELLSTPEHVPSPTFTLVQTYETDKAEVWHADLYRLATEEEIEELGLLDAMTDEICLIEWPERLGVYTPDHALTLEISPTQSEKHRRLSARWCTKKWIKKLEGWRREQQTDRD